MAAVTSDENALYGVQKNSIAFEIIVIIYWFSVPSKKRFSTYGIWDMYEQLKEIGYDWSLL